LKEKKVEDDEDYEGCMKMKMNKRKID